jgi:hypothetical protein
VWETTIDGRPLHFHLAGINNQNFIMRDEETGSWWQQVSGEAILGPLKGRRLTRVPMDEISFALWKREQPHGRVLRPDPSAAKHYASADWEAGIAKLPVTSPIRDKRLDPRELVVGVVLNGHAKAYQMSDVQQQNPIIDTVGGVSIVIVADRQSVRAFSRLVDGKPVDLFARADAASLTLVDATTGSEWDFSGRAIRGPLSGRQLQRIEVLRDYWFDWRAYHPDTAIFGAGLRSRHGDARRISAPALREQPKRCNSLLLYREWS